MTSHSLVLALLALPHADALRPVEENSPDCPDHNIWKHTNCYVAKWMNDMLEADPHGKNKVFMDVGCNTGVDAALYLSRWGRSHDAGDMWSKQLSTRVSPGKCRENYALREWNQTKATMINRLAAHAANTDPRVLCVEPMPANVRLLEEVNNLVFGPDSPLEIINAAASDSNGTAFFPDAPTGNEGGVLSSKPQKGTVSVQVKVATVDELLSERNIKHVDVLTIDTEGYDPAVLRGAQETLRYRGVRYLTFEVHQDIPRTPWHSTMLISVIEFMSAEQFDCYWAGNDGYLRLLTGCWDTKEDSKGRIGWANVACVRRGDKWQNAMKKYVVN